MSKVVQPSINETAFNCPHCSAFTTQVWYQLHALQISGDSRTPFIVREEHRQSIIDREIAGEARTHLLEHLEKLISGFVTLEEKQIDNTRGR